MSLRLLSRSFRFPMTRSVISLTRPFSTSTHSFMDRHKPPATATGAVEPTMSMSLSRDSNVDDEFEATNSDADLINAPPSRGINSMGMSMVDEQAKERMEMSEKDDWTEEAEAMAQDIHTSRGVKPPVDTDYM